MQHFIEPTRALLACTRRKFLSTALQFSGMALSSAACGQFSAAPAPSTSLTVREVTMATPDIVCVEILDAALVSFALHQTKPPTGDQITNIVKNPSGGFRITCANAPTYA